MEGTSASGTLTGSDPGRGLTIARARRPTRRLLSEPASRGALSAPGGTRSTPRTRQRSRPGNVHRPVVAGLERPRRLPFQPKVTGLCREADIRRAGVVTGASGVQGVDRRQRSVVAGAAVVAVDEKLRPAVRGWLCRGRSGPRGGEEGGGGEADDGASQHGGDPPAPRRTVPSAMMVRDLFEYLTSRRDVLQNTTPIRMMLCLGGGRLGRRLTASATSC